MFFVFVFVFCFFTYLLTVVNNRNTIWTEERLKPEALLRTRLSLLLQVDELAVSFFLTTRKILSGQGDDIQI